MTTQPNPKDPQAELHKAITQLLDTTYGRDSAPTADKILALFQAREQQLITELLGELPKPKKIEIYNAYNQPDDPFPMGFNAAIGETVSVIEKYREGL